MNPESVALKRAITITAVALGLLAMVSGVVAWTIANPGVALAAVSGVGVAAFVSMSTQAVMIEGLRRSPAGFVGLVLGSYVIKVAVLLLILVAVRESDLPRGAFVIPLVIGAVATLVIDIVVVVRARVPNVSPGRGNEAG